MRICFVAINAKYIHTSPAVRLLNKVVNSKYDSTYYEFTIKDNINNIIEIIKEYDFISFSCYIWNIEFVLKLVKQFKQEYPQKIVFAGGPEVSYDTKAFVDDFDYVISGEGEEVLIPFLEAVENNTELPEGVATKYKPIVKAQFVKDMNNIPNIIDLYSEEDKKNRIIYVETTRGCPFKCSYCLSSLEKGVRFFNDEYIESLFEFIENNEFKCIKFLDRTFNVNPKRFLKICERLEKTKNNYQFEIAAELFDDKVIDYFMNKVTPNKFRLEVGIQSLMNKTIESVDRKQDSEKLIKVLSDINNANRTVIHVDLIAGLPYETLDMFKETFNKTFLMLCEELQLGFLKLLRGTKIRNEANLYDYKFDSSAPYEVISNKFLSSEELQIIHDCENALEWMWNNKRCVSFIKHLVKDNIITNYFDFFEGYNKYYDKTKQLYENYESLCQYLKDINIYKKEYIDDLKLDYLNIVKIKPKPFWNVEENIDNYRKLLGYQNTNYLITPYYDKYIVIKYEKNQKPALYIE